MLFYKVIAGDVYDYFTGNTTIENELLTQKERDSKFRYLSDNVFQPVEISKKKTYWSFGARFENHDNIALRKIYDDLKAGFSYGKDYTWDYYDNKPIRFPFFDTAISYNPASDIFYYRHFGSSAIAADINKLSWLIETIFDCSPTEFLKHYIRNDQSTIA